MEGTVSKAVSYTHLDVYKRQAEKGAVTPDIYEKALKHKMTQSLESPSRAFERPA